MRTLTLTLLVAAMLLSGACGTSLVAVPLPELDDVEEALGYSLAPTHLPEGFEFSSFQLLESPELLTTAFDEFTAFVFYNRFKNDASHNVLVQYPWSFPPSVSYDFLLERLGLEWQRPDDAVSEVKVNGETAYLVRGNWSVETLKQLNKPDPELLAEYTPEWDYEGLYLSLYFDFELSPDEVVGVMIRAMLYPTDWITAKELVKIAESIRRLD